MYGRLLILPKNESAIQYSHYMALHKYDGQLAGLIIFIKNKIFIPSYLPAE